jgi:retron-type reverse transcriptase
LAATVENDMKRIGRLFPKLVAWENLVLAARLARRHKRFRPDVLKFEYFCERELVRLQDELSSNSYQPGPYRSFWIREPKLRLISAAPYRDRVVHHALCNVVEPIFERCFINDSYACRDGKGTHAGVRRVRYFARKYDYVLKGDVEKFFPSIDHRVVCDLFAAKIKDRRIVTLLEQIVAHSNEQPEVLRYYPGDDLFTPHERRRGLPIGNQTSQFLANVMLNPLDHFVKEELRIDGYVRYCDDFLVFANDKRRLDEARREIRRFLQTLRLYLHDHKSVIFPVRTGIPFLGYRVFPSHCLLAKDNVHRFRRRLRRMQQAYATGQIDAQQVHQRIVSWLGHASHAATFNLTMEILNSFPFVRQAASEVRAESERQSPSRQA